MPTIIDYSLVLNCLQSHGLKCHYYNSGAFGFPADTLTISRGWIGPEDGSIRESVRQIVRQIGEPHAERLASLLISVRKKCLTGPAWVMPKSHWAFEMEYGSAAWMPALLKDIGLVPANFTGLNSAAAIEFGDDEDAALEMFIRRLLEGLTGSDFMLAFRDGKTICTIHSHVQLWWTTADPALADLLDEAVSGTILTTDRTEATDQK